MKKKIIKNIKEKKKNNNNKDNKEINDQIRDTNYNQIKHIVKV